MTTITSEWPTLAELSKRLDPQGGIDDIVEILNEVNEPLDMIPWVEGNLPTGHRHTIRTGLPTPTWRKLYGGVQPTKSRTEQVTDNCGMLEAYAEVDKALADLNGNTAAFRLSENRAHIEGMSQEFMSTLFYGNEGTEPEAFTGLAPRFNSLSAENADNFVWDTVGNDDGGSTSIWLIVWGMNSVHGIVPKGSKTGLQNNDKGQVTIEDVTGSGGGRMEAYRTHYRWDCGLTVKDWRYVVRIGNIDVSELDGVASSSEADLVDLMTQALELPPSLGAGRAAFYMNRNTRSILRRQIVSKTLNSTVSWETVAGRRVMMFGEVPVYRCDAILNTESLVS